MSLATGRHLITKYISLALELIGFNNNLALSFIYSSWRFRYIEIPQPPSFDFVMLDALKIDFNQKSCCKF